MKRLLTHFNKNNLELKNHVVMAPMTRSRAIDNIPNDLMATYYEQRSGAGLIIAEGTAPAPEALGYPRKPGVFSEKQVEGWKKVTPKVHNQGSKIFLQLMHTGRIGHVDNLPEGQHLVGPSDVIADGEIFTDTQGLVSHSKPKALTPEGINRVKESFVKAAKNAIEAGFDGVELHGANGYLLEQFLNPHVNTRIDEYGGNIENRTKLTLEAAQEVAEAIGKGRTGIRLSPYSTLGDLPTYEEENVHQTYVRLAQKLNDVGLIYLHISMNPQIPDRTLQGIRKNFSGIIIQCNGLTPNSAEDVLQDDFADLTAFGRSFLANPDFVQRIARDDELNEPDPDTFYTPGPKGYTDYPFLEIETV